MDLALDNTQRLICHKTQITNQRPIKRGLRCTGLDYTLDLMGKPQFWRSRECAVPLYCHYSLVLSNPK